MHIFALAFFLHLPLWLISLYVIHNQMITVGPEPSSWACGWAFPVAAAKMINGSSVSQSCDLKRWQKYWCVVRALRLHLEYQTACFFWESVKMFSYILVLFLLQVPQASFCNWEMFSWVPELSSWRFFWALLLWQTMASNIIVSMATRAMCHNEIKISWKTHHSQFLWVNLASNVQAS